MTITEDAFDLSDRVAPFWVIVDDMLNIATVPLKVSHLVIIFLPLCL